MSFREIHVFAPGVPGVPPLGLSVMPNAVPLQLMGVPTNSLLPGVQANSLAAGADQAAAMVGPMLPFNAKSQQGAGEHRQRQPRQNTDQQQHPQKLQLDSNQESSFEHPSEKPAPLPSPVPVPQIYLVRAALVLLERLPYQGMCPGGLMVVWEGMAVCNATAAGSLAGTDGRHKEGRCGGRLGWVSACAKGEVPRLV